jgi:hypothetical protein
MDNEPSYSELLELGRKERDRLKTNIAELEKERDELKLANSESKKYIESELGPIFHNVYPHKTFNPKVHQAIRDLKQQANALSDYAYSDKPLTKRGLNLESIALNDKATALKDQP